jgi:ABC-type Fe3+-hydroxamate transport system substrate-binding protein
MVRVVSLVPSVTETLLDWGMEPVACTRFCEQPALTHVGGTKDPDVDAIIALHPDLVVVDVEENRVEDAEALRAAGVQVHVLRIRSIGDLQPQLDALSAVVGRPHGSTALNRFEAIGLRAFIPIWRRPWMTINGHTYGSSLLAHLGVDNVYEDDETSYPVVELDEVADREPDIVVVPSEPYPFSERHRDELEIVAPLVFVDGRDLFWWGARTAAAAGRLHDVLSRAVEPPPTA